MNKDITKLDKVSDAGSALMDMLATGAISPDEANAFANVGNMTVRAISTKLAARLVEDGRGLALPGAE